MLDPGQLGLGPGREAVLPARVVGEFLVTPVALVERRVAQHRVRGEPREGVGAQAVTGTYADLGSGGQGQAQGGEGGQVGVGVLGAEHARGPDRAQECAGARGGVEHGGAGVGGGGGEGGHQRGGAGRGERVLPRVGVEVTSEQELEDLPGARLRGEFGGPAQ